MGLQKPVTLGKPRECAGITAMIHNEVQAAQGYPSWRDYMHAPLACSRARSSTRWTGCREMPGRP